MEEEKYYLVTTPSGRSWKRRLTDSKAAQLRQAGFTLEEIEEASTAPNRNDQRRRGLHIGKYRMPGRSASRKAKKENDSE